MPQKLSPGTFLLRLSLPLPSLCLTITWIFQCLCLCLCVVGVIITPRSFCISCKHNDEVLKIELRSLSVPSIIITLTLLPVFSSSLATDELCVVLRVLKTYTMAVTRSPYLDSHSKHDCQRYRRYKWKYIQKIDQSLHRNSTYAKNTNQIYKRHNGNNQIRPCTRIRQ